MKTFRLFLMESPQTAIQFDIKNSVTKAIVPVLFDQIQKTRLDIDTYMRGFSTSSVKRELGKNIKALVYFEINRFVIFVFGGPCSHWSMTSSLKDSSVEFNLPKIDYNGLYHRSYYPNESAYTPGEWCFPIFIDSNSNVSTNLTKDGLDTLNKNANIKKVLNFSDARWAELEQNVKNN